MATMTLNPDGNFSPNCHFSDTIREAVILNRIQVMMSEREAYQRWRRINSTNGQMGKRYKTCVSLNEETQLLRTYVANLFDFCVALFNQDYPYPQIRTQLMTTPGLVDEDSLDRDSFYTILKILLNPYPSLSTVLSPSWDSEYSDVRYSATIIMNGCGRYLYSYLTSFSGASVDDIMKYRRGIWTKRQMVPEVLTFSHQVIGFVEEERRCLVHEIIWLMMTVLVLYQNNAHPDGIMMTGQDTGSEIPI